MTASSEVPRPPLPRLHLVTDDGVLTRHDFEPLALRLAGRGGERVALHLRGPRTGGRALWRYAGALAEPVRAAGAVLLVNDRVDIARACGAAGVQLGETSFPPREARRLLGGTAWIGASVHDREAAAAAADDGADFLLAGTLWETASHPGRAGLGAAWLRELLPLGVPVLGIGGVTPGRAAEVRRAGGHGVAVIRGVWAAPDPAAALDAFLEALE